MVYQLPLHRATQTSECERISPLAARHLIRSPQATTSKRLERQERYPAVRPRGLDGERRLSISGASGPRCPRRAPHGGTDGMDLHAGPKPAGPAVRQCTCFQLCYDLTASLTPGPTRPKLSRAHARFVSPPMSSAGRWIECDPGSLVGGRARDLVTSTLRPEHPGVLEVVSPLRGSAVPPIGRH